MNRIIVVTGGAGGIGRCIVAHFASQGDSVYFMDQNQQATLTQVEKMRERGWQVTGFVGDVAEKQALEEFAALVLREHPEGIHCLINNACLMRGGILSDCDYESFLYVQRVGVVAPYMLARLFKDHFQGLGAIVNISSTRAFQSQPDTESYTAAKGGITALTHALAVSLSGVARVNSVAPGWIDTGAYHEKRIMKQSIVWEIPLSIRQAGWENLPILPVWWIFFVMSAIHLSMEKILRSMVV